jgi:hypothetical protein
MIYLQVHFAHKFIPSLDGGRFSEIANQSTMHRYYSVGEKRSAAANLACEEEI